MKYLIETVNLPENFDYPFAIYKLEELGLVNFDIWQFMEADCALERMKDLEIRYPKRKLVPFAMKRDCDDIACFDLEQGYKVNIIHDYASEGYEQHEIYDNVWDWIKHAIDDMIEFEVIEENF